MDKTIAASTSNPALIALLLFAVGTSVQAQNLSTQDRPGDALLHYVQAKESGQWITETYVGRGCQFRYRVRAGQSEQIEILDDWQAQNISVVEVPQLSKLTPGGKVLFNKAGAEALKSGWAEVEAQGLLNLVVSWDGSYVARTMRGTQRPAVHSCGLSFDINNAANPLGRLPALEGQKGSVRRLVPIFERFGFEWGGRLSRFPDGSHFEFTTNSNNNR